MGRNPDRVLELPPGLLERTDPGDFHLALRRLDGGPVATSMAFDHDGDAGVYNVGTLERARRRGLGSAVVGVLLRDAVARGARTATLQSTGMAQGCTPARASPTWVGSSSYVRHLPGHS